ncbi:MAG: hypothetical protein K8W52_42090 [Deltaproteobacteria bacterium]|nr:hypothetical protein [Deltaproteobacteria bacterium]
MLPGLASWRRQLLPDGVAFAHPAGPDHGALHIRDRQPLRDLRRLAADTLARMPATLTDGALSPLRPIVTLEGEYGAAITLTARFADGGRYVRALGAVHGDDFQRQIDAVLVRPGDDDADALVERVDALVRHACIGLGVRRRRFLYTPPPGWHGRAFGLLTRWFAPGFPREAATIIIPPAMPVTEQPGIATLERLVHEAGPVAFEPEEPPEIEALTLDGMSGTLSRASGHYPGQPRATLQLAELADRRHAYRMTLEATADLAGMAEQAFRAVLRSMTRIPEPTAPVIDSSVMSHWVD